MDSEGQPVRFRDCTCPGTPHTGRDGADDGDIVVLRPALGFAAGAEALRAMIESDGDLNRIAELVGPVYLRVGPQAWNVLADSGPAPLSAVADLPYSDAYPIVEAADSLYSEVVMAPLLKRMSGLSGPTSNGRPTSATRRSSTKARSRRDSSLQNGSAGQPSPVNP